VAGVTGRLHVFVDGIEITPVAGVPAINEPFTAPLAPQRANENHTLNFELPAPTGITASANVDFQVDVTAVAGETNTANNSGFANDLTFVDRTTPRLFFTRIDYTPAGLGLPAVESVQPGVGDAFVRGILPVNDADPELYQEGLFPSLTYTQDDNVNNLLDGCTPSSPSTDNDNLLSLLASCRQLIVDSGEGASDRIFLVGWLAGNPTGGDNGCASIGGRVAYVNTEDARYQRSYAHELTHNFGFDHNSDSIAPEVGWDVGARLVNNPAANNTNGRVKPTTRFDIQNPGQVTNSAWIKTGLPDGYQGLLNHPTLASAGPDFSMKVLVIQGSFDPTGVQLRQLKPVFRFPWLSRPTPPTPPSPGIGGIAQLREPFTVRVVDVNGSVITVPFSPLVANDALNEQEKIGFFEVMVPLAVEANSLEISNILGMPVGGFVRSAVAPSIQIVAPLPGATLGRITRVAWNVADPDTPRAQLMFQVAYSFDNGSSFVPIGVDQTGNEVTFDATAIPPSRATGLIRVFVSDGLNTSFADVTGLSTNRRPTCTGAVADPATLWPPNHKFVAVAINGVTDPDGNPVTITPTSILQDEAVRDPKAGSGNTSPDATLSPLAVRAERNGTGNGRVYHIGFAADDGQGGTCTGTVKVCVPHDQRPGGTCVDDGPLFNSLVP
jgi:hypothetical protein